MNSKGFNEDQWYHKERILFTTLRVTVSLFLLVGGIVLLALRIPGWGIILGLPMIIFGAVFIIYTYDEVLSKQVDSHKEDSKQEDE